MIHEGLYAELEREIDRLRMNPIIPKSYGLRFGRQFHALSPANLLSMNRYFLHQSGYDHR